MISSNSNFVKVLADGLNFKNRDFEVALTDLVFTDSYSPPSPVPPTPPTPLPPVVPKFFDGKNNVFKTWLQSKVKYTTTKATVASKTVPSQVVSFVSALNTFLKIHKAPIEIMSFKKDEDPSHRTVLKISKSGPDKIFTLSENLLRPLGFTANSFAHGSEYTSQNLQSDHEYKLLPDDADLSITGIHWVQYFQTIKEPEEYSYADLIDSYADSLDDEPVRIFLTRVDSIDILHVFIDNLECQLQLQSHINKLFGLPEDFIFSELHEEILLQPLPEI